MTIFLISLILAVTPSLLWLSFYLRKDAHPEPNWMILKVFLYGCLAVVPATILELGTEFLSNQWKVILLLSVLIEEIIKYLVIRWIVFRSPELDEPVDLMLYMVISALGFAALENLFFLLNPALVSLMNLIEITAVRFITAVFIHALSSGLFGYFLAKKYFLSGKRKRFSLLGFLSAVFLHLLYNSFIITLSSRTTSNPSLVYGLLIILPLGFIILELFSFRHLKKLKVVS
jgi:protease PrsW